MSLPVRVRPRARIARTFETSTGNISAHGMYFIVDEAFDLGSELELEMKLPPEVSGGESLRARCLGRIAHVERMAAGRIGVGVNIKHFEFIRGA